jgi:hypothetical protein
MRRRLWLLVLAAPLGCLNEYHPEYRPETSVTYVQNVSYPQTTVVVMAPAGAREDPRAVASSGRPKAPARPSAEVPPPARGGGPSEHPATTSAPRQEEAVARVTPLPDVPWVDLFAEERAERRRQAAAREPGDAWDRIVGRRRPGEGEIDVVADVPLAQARAIARHASVEARCVLQGSATSYQGTVIAVRRHAAEDGLAQVLIKVRDLPWPASNGKPVAVTVAAGGDPREVDSRTLTIGHVAGQAAEGAWDALVRERLCTVHADGDLYCGGGSMRMARFDGLPDGRR